MAFFPRYTNTFGADIAPLFRMLDEGLADVNRHVGRHASVRAFAPRFDVNELKDSYQLHGELPGIEQKDIEIEFTDPHTLVIKGRTESSYEARDGQAIEGAPVKQGRIEGTVDESHQPTVEDEENTTTDVATTTDKKDVSKQSEQQQAPFKSWISERSVGEFHRSFSFPQRVDQDLVKASLKNGILSIIVPKAKAPESRKINIE
jgi:HSP20 family molecular chaperone IbpA